MKTIPLKLCPLLLTVACGAPASVSDDTEAVSEANTISINLEAVSEASPISIDDWLPETIELPPGFAPDMPKGVEQLLLAPGFRDSTAADHWAYALTMWIDEPAPDAYRLDEILEIYYDGLLLAVADKDVGNDPAQVEVVSTGWNEFEVQIQAIDAFGDHERIDLRLLVSSQTDELTELRIRVSPKPKEHAIWRALEAASASIQKP